jgi:hypothetical protein
MLLVNSPLAFPPQSPSFSAPSNLMSSLSSYGPSVLCMGTLEGKRKNIMAKLYGGKRANNCPNGNYCLTHSTDSGPREAYVINERKQRTAA